MKKILFLALAILAAVACEKDVKKKSSTEFIGFDFTKENFLNGEYVITLERDGITLTLSPRAQWYKDDQALCVYGGGTIALSAEETIEKITFTFADHENAATITACEGELSENIWTGANKRVFFKVEGLGHYCGISRIAVKLGSKPSDNMTDVITSSFTGITSNNVYQNWSGKKGTTSVATYSGMTAVVDFNDIHSILFHQTDKCGIVSRTTAGFVRHIQIWWGRNTELDRDVEVYGDDIAYSGPSDLYNSSYAGTLLGTFDYHNPYPYTIINVTGNYKYVGLRPKGDSNTANEYRLYIDKIEITWE
ncbi:MAG: hypothetical protein IKP46_00815 [Bacteroidales bacterium]|nr:hypothetical protein [Bacteroidales bacterium]